MEQSIFLDFKVDSNPYYLLLTDLSNWLTIEGKPTIVEITLPGFEEPVTKYFDQYKVNQFNSNSLGLPCCDGCDPERVTLPDGIYKIKLIGSPSNFCKQYYYLKTDLIDADIAKVYIKYVERNDRKEVMEQLHDIETMLRAAAAYTKYENVRMAAELYQKSADIIEKLLNCDDCVRVWW